jgi:hypothetical protein
MSKYKIEYLSEEYDLYINREYAGYVKKENARYYPRCGNVNSHPFPTLLAALRVLRDLYFFHKEI